MSFRTDVQALRAWAVMLVVLYHMKVPGFAGGLMGVDIFFVVSGFLMTQIISRDLAQHRFSYARFLMARTRRIVPGLFALIALALIMGLALTPPQSFAELGSSAWSSALFVSNLHYIKTLNYFGDPADYQPLVHTWSLSVEWQFYMIWPLALGLAHRQGWSERKVWRLTLLLAIASLAFATVASSHIPGVVFYSPLSRAWELLLGALVAMGEPRTEAAPRSPTRGRRLAWAGWLLLLPLPWALAQLSWPAPWALMPCLGAVMILRAGTSIGWTDHPIIQALGRWSYSIYLFHWPIHVLVATLGWSHQPAIMAGAVLLSVAAGAAGYRWIETPGRQLLSTWTDVWRPRNLRAARPMAVTLALITLSVTLSLSHGWPSRFGQRVHALEISGDDYNPDSAQCLANQKWPLVLPRCQIGPNATPVGLYVWGDSHGDAMLPALEAATHAHIEFSGHAGCAPVPGNHGKLPRCGDFSRMAQQYFESAPAGTPLVIVGRFTDYFDPWHASRENPLAHLWRAWRGQAHQTRDELLDAMESSMCRLAQRRPVYVTRPSPEMPDHVPIRATLTEMLGQHFTDDTIATPIADVMARHAAVNARLDQIAAHCGIHVIDTTPALCQQGSCRAALRGQPLFVDQDHLSLAGAALLVPTLRSALPGATHIADASLDDTP